MGISNDAQEDVDEFGAASAELKQFPWDQKFIAWEAEARYDLEFRIGSLEQEVYALRRENADLSTRAKKAEAMVERLQERENEKLKQTISEPIEDALRARAKKAEAMVERLIEVFEKGKDIRLIPDPEINKIQEWAYKLKILVTEWKEREG